MQTIDRPQGKKNIMLRRIRGFQGFKQQLIFGTIAAAILFSGCSPEKAYDENADKDGFTAPTEITRQKNAAVSEKLALNDPEDFQQAQRGLIARSDDMRVTDTDGGLLWDMQQYSFIQGKAPASVNPSLWRQAKLNNIHGLFEVTPGIYQLRGFDLSNMTLIEGQNGWIVIDPLTTMETASKAIAFARKHLPSKPIAAIVYTHSHIDHYGGVLGVISAEDAAKAQIPVVAPRGFMAEATSENIIAGIAMGRRAEYQFGRNLPASERGYVDTGLGKRTPFGNFSILAPTDIVAHTPQEMTIDGVRFVFQYTPESEAPAEMTFYLPDFKTYCGAEIVSRNMHNVYTLRGAKVRDALKWSGYIDEAITLFGTAEIYFASHHWPIWGNEKILTFLEKQRDLYKYIHDQTMRLANMGYTPRELSEMLALPDSLDTYFSNRGYYGTLKHNSKAVYQGYLGWYDGNPANLDPLPPEASAKRYVAYMGGGEAILTKARKSFDKGEYRWVAEVLNHLVFAQPDNQEAKALLAMAYDQLGYQAESGVWRSAYLTAAYELRHGVAKKGLSLAKVYEILKRTPMSSIFDSMSVRLDGPGAAGKKMVINVVLTDRNESYVLTLKNAVLHHKAAGPAPDADVTLNISHDLFIRMLVGKAGIKETILSDDLAVTGSRMDLIRFLMLLGKPETNFNVVTP